MRYNARLIEAFDNCLEDRPSQDDKALLLAALDQLVLNGFGADQEITNMLQLSPRFGRNRSMPNWENYCEWLAQRIIRNRHHRQDDERKDLPSHLPLDNVHEFCKWVLAVEHVQEFKGLERRSDYVDPERLAGPTVEYQGD